MYTLDRPHSTSPKPSTVHVSYSMFCYIDWGQGLGVEGHPQRSEENVTKCSALSLSALFSGDSISHQIWSLASSHQASATLPWPPFVAPGLQEHSAALSFLHEQWGFELRSLSLSPEVSPEFFCFISWLLTGLLLHFPLSLSLFLSFSSAGDETQGP